MTHSYLNYTTFLRIEFMKENKNIQNMSNNHHKIKDRISEALHTENIPAMEACIQEMLIKDRQALKKFRIGDTLDSILHLAVHTKSAVNLKTILRYKKHLDLLAKNRKSEYTCLCLACTLDDAPVEILELLIEAEPTLVNTPAANEIYPIHLAVQHRRLDAIKCLVKANSFLNCQNIFKETALHYAAFRVDDTVRYNYFHVDYDEDNIAVIKYLVRDLEVCTTIEDMNGKTALKVIEEITIECDEADLVTYYVYLRDCLKIFMPLEKCYDFGFVFKLMYLSIKARDAETVKYYLDKYYLDEAYNNYRHKFVTEFQTQFNPEGHDYYMCLPLHDNFKVAEKNLKDYIRGLSCSDVFLERLTSIFKHSTNSSEKKMIIHRLVKQLQFSGIDFSTWKLAQKLSVFNEPDISNRVSIEQAFNLYKLIFQMDIGINFNSSSIEFIDKFCSDHSLKYWYLIELLLPFTSHIFIDYYCFMDDLNLGGPVVNHAEIQYFNRLSAFHPYLTHICCQKLMKCSAVFIPVVFSLKQICREHIRERVFNHKSGQTDNEFVFCIMSLPLPVVLKKYLRFLDKLQFLDLETDS